MNNEKNIYAIKATPIDPWSGKVIGKHEYVYVTEDEVKGSRYYRNGEDPIATAECNADFWLSEMGKYKHYSVKFVKMVARGEHICD